MTGTVMALDDRKQAEAALQEREAVLRLFIQYAPAGIAMLDRDMRSHYEIFPNLEERLKQSHQRGLAGFIEEMR